MKRVKSCTRRCGIKLVEIKKLKSHEKVNKNHLNKLIKVIKADGVLKNPVVVDKKTYVILDGHHRVAALKFLGCRKIPVLAVNYNSNQIKVYLRRRNLLQKIIKEAVINRALLGKDFPTKTTRHYTKKRRARGRFFLSSLKLKT